MHALAEAKGGRKMELLKILTEPMTRHALAKALGIGIQSCLNYLHELENIGLVRRVGIEKHHHNDATLWMAQCTQSECDEDDLEAKIFRRKPVVVNVHRDPLVAALFGEVPHE